MSVVPLCIYSKIWEREIVRLELKGHLGSQTTASLEESFVKWFGRGKYSFAIRLSEIVSMTSAGAAVFVSLVRMAQDADGEVFLVSPSEPVKLCLRRLQILQLFHVVSSLEEVR